MGYKIQIDQIDIDWSKSESKNISNLNNSITKGKGAFFGKLGERLFKKKFTESKYVNNFDHDFILRNSRIEIKTKVRTVEPEPHFNVTVAEFNINQDCDYYVFVQIQKDLSCGYLLGYIKKSDFYKKARLNKLNESDTQNFDFRANCYNLKINELNQFNFSGQNQCPIK